MAESLNKTDLSDEQHRIHIFLLTLFETLSIFYFDIIINTNKCTDDNSGLCMHTTFRYAKYNEDCLFFVASCGQIVPTSVYYAISHFFLTSNWSWHSIFEYVSDNYTSNLRSFPCLNPIFQSAHHLSTYINTEQWYISINKRCKSSHTQTQEIINIMNEAINYSPTTRRIDFVGISLLWSDTDEEGFSDDFRAAELINLNPFWVIVKGLCLGIGSVKASISKLSDRKVSQSRLELCLSILNCLLRPKEELAKLCIGHVYAVVATARGFCFDKKLQIYRFLAKEKLDIINLLERAIEDECVQEEYRIKFTRTLLLMHEREELSPYYLGARIDFKVHTMQANYLYSENSRRWYSPPQLLSTIITNDFPKTFLVEEVAMMLYLDKIAQQESTRIIFSNGVLNREQRKSFRYAFVQCLRETEAANIRGTSAAGLNSVAAAFSRKRQKMGSQWNSSWCEGSLFNALFYLILWDAINDTCIPFSWVRPWQLSPLDFYTGSFDADLITPLSKAFYKRRKSAIDFRLGSLTNYCRRELEDQISSMFRNLSECKSEERQNMHRRVLMVPKIVLSSFAGAVGGKRLEIILKAMVSCPSSYMRGHPDLFFWKTPSHSHTSKYAGSDVVFAVEVKSENDDLSKSQVLWIQLLESVNISVEVAKVLDHRG